MKKTDQGGDDKEVSRGRSAGSVRAEGDLHLKRDQVRKMDEKSHNL